MSTAQEQVEKTTLEQIQDLYDDIIGMNGDTPEENYKLYKKASSAIYKMFKQHSDGIFFLNEEEISLLQEAQDRKRELQQSMDAFGKELKDRDCIYEGEIPRELERGFKLAENLIKIMTADKASLRRAKDSCMRAGTQKVDGEWKKIVHQDHPRKKELWNLYNEKRDAVIQAVITELENTSETRDLVEQEVRKLEYFKNRLEGNTQA